MVSAHLGGRQHPAAGCCPRGGWVGRAGLAHLTHLPGGIQARRVGGWGVLGLREKRVRLEGPLLDRTPVSKNMPLFTATLASQRLEEIFSRAPPTHQAGSKPAWQVGEVRKPSAPHPPTTWATPHRGVLPTPQVGRDQLPLSHKPTASARPPFSL